MHAAGVAVESIGGIVVAHVIDGAASDARNIHVGGGRDFSGYDARAGGDQDFACHAAGGVVRQYRVQYGVRNLIRNLVWMTFGDGFRSEKMSLMICQNSLLRVC